MLIIIAKPVTWNVVGSVICARLNRNLRRNLGHNLRIPHNLRRHGKHRGRSGSLWTPLVHPIVNRRFYGFDVIVPSQVSNWKSLHGVVHNKFDLSRGQWDLLFLSRVPVLGKDSAVLQVYRIGVNFVENSAAESSS